MGRRAVGLCGGLCMVVLLGWAATVLPRGGTLDPVASPSAAPAAELVWPASPDALTGPGAPAWLAAAAASDLAPTGIELISAAGVDSMVVDGTGAVWLDGAWQLSRVDPATGSAQTWDVSDDATFATMSAVRPSGGGGVWLMEDHRLRLFDGRRFVRDLPVPAALRGGEGRHLNDMVEVGTEVWVSSAAGVARYTQSQAWSMVGPGSIAAAGMLAVDSAGHVWSMGRVASEGAGSHVLLRFDGVRWAPPGRTGAPSRADEIVADPTGGVLVRVGRAVRRFDGATWRRLPLLPPVRSERYGVTPRALCVGPDGVVWVVGFDGLYRHEAPGGWQAVARGEQFAPVGMGILGREILVADASGLLRLDGDRLSRLWARRGPGLGAPLDNVLVVSSDEVWATAQDGVQQFRDGRWRTRWTGLGWQGGAWLEWGSERPLALALATDAAVWAITDRGLVRFEGSSAEVIPRDHVDGWLLPGPDGAVWAVQAILSGWSGWYVGEESDGSSVSLVQPGGTQASVRLPGSSWSLTSIAAGVDGSVWVTICEKGIADYCTVPALMRWWEGQWSHVPHPGAGITGVSVAPDGGLWARVTQGDSFEEEPVVARCVDGTWTRFPEATGLAWTVPAPQGRVCGGDRGASALVCLDPTGRVSRVPLEVPGQVRIGPDGSLWMQDSGVLARLPGVLPE